MAKKKVVRCPFRDECERKCEHEFKELECDYYKNNARGDSVLEDQEKLRELKEERSVNEMYEAMMSEYDDSEEDLADKAVVNVVDSSSSSGDFSDGSEIKLIELGRIAASNNNVFAVENDITALAEDIKVNGLLSPLTVCPSEEEGFYRLISGHRRYKALCSLYENSFEVACVVTRPKSPEVEEYMLIQANITSRTLDWSQKQKVIEQAEKLLLKLKEQGMEFPGKLRTHVAKLLKTSEAQIAKSNYVSKHMIPELQTVSDNNINFDARYKIAHWPENIQKSYYDNYVSKGRYVWDVDYYSRKINSGEDPFAPQPASTEPKQKMCYRGQNVSGVPCDNVENLELYKGAVRERFGCNMKCDGNCCFYCPNRFICPGVCKTAKADIDNDRMAMDVSDFYVYRIRLALRSLLVEKGFNEVKIEDLEDLDGLDLQEDYKCLYTCIYDSSFDVRDLLWYLSKLEVTPNEFFEMVEKHTDPPYEPDDIKPTWKIYLGAEEK